MTSPLPDPYAILGVAAEASDDDLDHAFRGLVRQYHPDTRTSESDNDADQRLQEILTAYATLRDPIHAAYDRSRARPAPASRAPTPRPRFSAAPVRADPRRPGDPGGTSALGTITTGHHRWGRRCGRPAPHERGPTWLPLTTSKPTARTASGRRAGATAPNPSPPVAGGNARSAKARPWRSGTASTTSSPTPMAPSPNTTPIAIAENTNGASGWDLAIRLELVGHLVRHPCHVLPAADMAHSLCHGGLRR
jgi:curved DNA-binding protein CbpA